MIEPSEVVQTLQRAVDSKLIPIWELHDATGDWSKMADIEAYWTSPTTLDILKRFDTKMIVNLANEAGATVSNQELTTVYSRLVSKLRDAGVKAPLMIDASGWGRNAEQLLEIAPILLNQDPLHNLIFSWHVYDSGSDQPARIQRVASSFKQQKLPFIIGEFGPKSPGACHLDVPWLEVIRTAQQLGLGYLPWSWDNFNGDCEDGEFSVFDLVTDGIHLSTLRSGWATEVIMTDAASINKTSRRTAWQEQGRCQ
ncbi:MAG: cellulase family glycosylhydrolase [Bdellovibrionales bacterium]|nr:cellulase family glycosylhydrolase [Bdellovibrionales bacterium]